MKDGFEQYRLEYNKKNIKRIPLNLSKIYDADILERLDEVGNKQGYIKELIRADISSEKILKKLKKNEKNS